MRKIADLETLVVCRDQVHELTGPTEGQQTEFMQIQSVRILRVNFVWAVT